MNYDNHANSIIVIQLVALLLAMIVKIHRKVLGFQIML